MFATILRVDVALPAAIKYLFDFFDCSAQRHNIVDPDVVHTWKSNSLLLRFWVNILKNPEFLFDINKSHIVDSCLSVIAQTFMDSCSTHEQRLGKDSPSSKLLYAKDIPRYRRLVCEFYKGVQDLPSISDLDMSLLMSEHSTMYATDPDLNVEAALQELLTYARQYRYELLEALDDNSVARRLQLGTQFERLSVIVEEQASFC
jgi:plexin A